MEASAALVSALLHGQSMRRQGVLHEPPSCMCSSPMSTIHISLQGLMPQPFNVSSAGCGAYRPSHTGGLGVSCDLSCGGVSRSPIQALHL